MSEKPRIRVPARALPTMTFLAELAVGEREALLRAFQETPTSAEGLRTRIADALHLDHSDSLPREIVSELFGLASLAESHSYSSESVGEVVAESPGLELDEGAQESFAHLFSELLASPAVRTLGKAADLAGEHHQVMHTVRVVTDVTPVFDSPDKEPVGGLVMHRLRVAYWEGSKLAHTEIAMTPAQLDEMSDALNRAKQKSTSIQAMLGRFALPYFVTEAD